MTESSFSGSDLSEVETAGEDSDEAETSLWVDRRVIHDEDDDMPRPEVSTTHRRRSRAPRAPRRRFLVDLGMKISASSFYIGIQSLRLFGMSLTSAPRFLLKKPRSLTVYH